ncbi:hypothetical protein K432DRAFT_256950, partial [Lepidopterella palustris CBS 459.81]
EGDLLLIVGAAKNKCRKLLISSRSFAAASPIWSEMLVTQSISSTSMPTEFQLPDDDAEALCLMLQVAHLALDNVPYSISFDMLYNLAGLCEKYDTIHLIRRFLPEWIQQLLS